MEDGAGGACNPAAVEDGAGGACNPAAVEDAGGREKKAEGAAKPAIDHSFYDISSIEELYISATSLPPS